MTPRLALLSLVLAACTAAESRFPVLVTVVTDDGKPVPGVAVALGRAPARATDGEGHLALNVLGHEGMKVPVTVEVPKGYRLSGSAPQLVLRRLNDLERGRGHLLPVVERVELAPLQRRYAVLVRVGVAGLPVETFGTRQAVTNGKGVAAFLYDGAPGDELQVRVATASHPDLRPQNPTASFVLGQRSEAYLVREHFTVEKPKPPRRKKPVPVGPRRL
jgi:hypothetical protein